jgi:hypothetical protein
MWEGVADLIAGGAPLLQGASDGLRDPNFQLHAADVVVSGAITLHQQHQAVTSLPTAVCTSHRAVNWEWGGKGLIVKLHGTACRESYLTQHSQGHKALGL